MNIPDRVKDALERAASSAGQQFLAVAVLVDFSKGILGLPWAFALATAGGAAAVSILLTVVQFSLGAQVLPFWADLTVRTSKTFAASLLATMGAGVVDLRSVPWNHALNVAGLAAFLALVKNLLSPNAHLSGSLLSGPVVARIHGVNLNGTGGFTRPNGDGGRTTAGVAIGVVLGIVAIVLLVKGWLIIGVLVVLAAVAAFVWL